METVSAKTIVTKVKKPAYWFGIDYNMNIYRGCSHGCIYCDSRSLCYQNPDFDRIKIKEDSLKLIRDDLRKKVKHGVIGTGAMSDPYNPFEKNLCLTRNSLELINAFRFGVAIDTKSSLIKRDLDILQDINKHSPVIVKITITTSDESICKILEPNVSNTYERFETVKYLSEGNIFCGILMTPLLPFINDTKENVINILCEAKKSGAKFVYPGFGVTLRVGNREYFYKKLDELFPGIKEKYINYYGNRYMCTSKKAKSLWAVFKSTCEELGLLYDMRDIIRSYRKGYENEQLSIF